MLINKTPHPIHILDDNNNIVKSITSYGSIRLSTETVDAGFTVDDVKITKTVFGKSNGLPEYNIGTFYIVSQLVKNAYPDREDLLVPSDVVRDDSGNIIGCRSLGI